MKIHRLNKLIEMSRTPIDAHPPIDRDELGPMVESYCHTMLECCGFGEYRIADISERLLSQLIRDCVYFYNFSRDTLDPLYALKEYSDRKCGRDFWRSRHKLGDGFANRGFEDYWDELDQRAWARFHPVDDIIYENAGVIDMGYSGMWEGWDIT